MNEADKEEFRKMIKDTLYETEPALCKIESMRMAQLENIVQKLSIVVIGNGHVKDSLMWKENKNTENIAKITALLERRRYNESGDRDQFKMLVRYLLDKILPTLITTAILGYVAFQIALSQKIITP